ncbi:unnamed protein product [Prunus brigantina]
MRQMPWLLHSHYFSKVGQINLIIWTEMCSMRLSPWSKCKGPKKFQRKGMPNLALWCPKRRKSCLRRCAMRCPPRKCPTLSPCMWELILNEFPVSKVLVDTGATINILPASIMRKLNKGSNELIPTETTVSGLLGDTTTSKGIIPL